MFLVRGPHLAPLLQPPKCVTLCVVRLKYRSNHTVTPKHYLCVSIDMCSKFAGGASIRSRLEPVPGASGVVQT